MTRADPRELRQTLALSQRAAGRLFRVRRQTICTWEAGAAPEAYRLALSALVALRTIDPELAARLLETTP